MQFPTNQVGFVGERVKFECKIPNFTLNREKIVWKYHSLDGVKSTSISENNNLSDRSKVTKYTIGGRHQSGEFHLNILDLKEADNGWYSCSYLQPTQTGVKVTPPQKYARLIVLCK